MKRNEKKVQELYEWLLDASEDDIKALDRLSKFSYDSSKACGWHSKRREAGTMLALIHSEISEALEGIRKDKMDDHLPHRKSVEVELADAVIRIFDFAKKHKLDLAGAWLEKSIYNLERDDHKPENRKKAGGKKF